MDKILIMGLGQMGLYYAKACKAAGYREEDIIGMDVNDGKMEAFKKLYPLSSVSVNLPDSVPVAIVATNTPSHHRDIQRLVEDHETRWIFCEKPLGINPEAVEDIEEVVKKNKARVFTAFLISFSPAVSTLIKKMYDEDLILIEGTTTWGKNRIGDSRPSPGNLPDESVHGVNALLNLANINQNVNSKAVTARLSFPKFVDMEAQKRAHEWDRSFPMDPNGTTKCLIDLHTDLCQITLLADSSFVRGDQVREITATLAHREAPEIPLVFAKLAFDLKGEKGTEDSLTLFDLQDRQKEKIVIKASCNKIQEELEAFLRVVRGEEADVRLTDLPAAKSMVSFISAARESNYDNASLTFA